MGLHLFQSQYFWTSGGSENSLRCCPAEPAREMQQEARRVKSIANLKEQSVRSHPEQTEHTEGWRRREEGFPEQ